MVDTGEQHWVSRDQRILECACGDTLCARIKRSLDLGVQFEGKWYHAHCLVPVLLARLGVASEIISELYENDDVPHSDDCMLDNEGSCYCTKGHIQMRVREFLKSKVLG